MSRLDELKKRLKRGNVYRRNELARWSTSVDRHLDELLQDGTLQKLSQGLYYYPKVSVFGTPPPEDQVLVESFLKDKRFLLTTPNAYNSLGVGTTQLYNTKVVYNHKRHGQYTLGNRKFNFRIKPHFPGKATPEFLLVDLVNNLETLAEDKTVVLQKVSARAAAMDRKKLAHAVTAYGGARAKKLLAPLTS